MKDTTSVSSISKHFQKKQVSYFVPLAIKVSSKFSLFVFVGNKKSKSKGEGDNMQGKFFVTKKHTIESNDVA